MRPDKDGIIHFRDKRLCLACRLGPGYPKVHTHPIWAPPRPFTVDSELTRGVQ